MRRPADRRDLGRKGKKGGPTAYMKESTPPALVHDAWKSGSFGKLRRKGGGGNQVQDAFISQIP